MFSTSLHHRKGQSSAKIVLIYTVVVIVLIVAVSFFRGTCEDASARRQSEATKILRKLSVCETQWAQNDIDKNGIKDYWTYDVSCFYRAYQSDYKTKIGYIPLDIARADPFPAPDNVFPSGAMLEIERWAFKANFSIMPKFGYYFRAMLFDEDGLPYNQELVDGVKATNKTKYAFVAYPIKSSEDDDSTMFIINQDGIVWCSYYRTDKDIVLQWPIINPAKKGPDGRYWVEIR